MSTGVTPFPRRPIPVPGESIYGFERRFAACTHYESLGAFRKATGLLEVVPGSVQEKFARLATLAGLEQTSLDYMRWTGRDGIRRGCSAILLGHEIHATYLRVQQLRFCPTCLAEDGPPEQRIHFQAWQILQVCACPRHRTLLVESCDSCGAMIEQPLQTKPWNCSCGREMTEIATTVAPSGAVAMSLAIMHRLGSGSAFGYESIDDPGTLPRAFSTLSLDALLTVISKIGMLATTPSEVDQHTGPKEKPYAGSALSNELSSAQVARIIDAADSIVRNWPKAANSLFASLAGRNPAPIQCHPVHSIFATRAGFRLLGRIKSTDGSRIRIIDDALEEWLFHERGVYIDGRQRPKVSTGGDTAIDVADALRRLEGRKGNPVGISAWVDAGAVGMIGEKVSLSSVEATVDALANLKSSDIKDGMSAEEWGTRFLFDENYRRADALRDILSGKIHIRRSQCGTRSGLASIQVSRADFTQSAREATAAARLIRRSPQQRAERARQKDAFYRSDKIYDLIGDLWPGRPVPDIAEHPYVRCRTKTWRYPDREMRQHFYSIADALDMMERRRE